MGRSRGSASAAASALERAAAEPGAFSRLAAGSSVKSVTSCAGSSYATRQTERPQSARAHSDNGRSAATQSAAASGYRRQPLSARPPRSTSGFSNSTASFGHDPYIAARMQVCTDVLSDGGRVPVKPVKRTGLRERSHDNISAHRDGCKPWLKGDLHHFNEAAGMASWEGAPQLKGTSRELDYLVGQAVKVSGCRHYPHHPLTRSLSAEVVHGHKFLDYRPPAVGQEEPSWVERAAGKTGAEVEAGSGLKKAKASELHRGQVDRVIFGHDTYLRPMEHPEAVYGGEPGAGWPTWREGPGLDTTLKATGALGSPDGYRRQGRTAKPPSESGSRVSQTHAFRGRKQQAVSPTHTSVLNAVVFNDRPDKSKPVLAHATQEFKALHEGAAGMSSGNLGRELLKCASHVVTKHDQLSVCSTEVSGGRSLRSSQSVPAVHASPRPISVTSNALYGRDTSFASFARGAARR